MSGARARRIPYAVVIVGGGAVGASLACALGSAGLRTALVEAAPLDAERRAAYDERMLALAQGTRRILEALGVWSVLHAAASPIRRIHVSDRGRFGFVRLRAEDYGLEALGWVVPARALGTALAERLAAVPDVEFLCPAQMEDVEVDAEAATVTVRTESGTRRLAARLVVGADGGRSRVREGLGIAIRERRYPEVAVIANVTPARDHGGTAYERFTDTGPIALLPLGEQRCGVVWTVPKGAAEQVLGLADADFLAALTRRFGMRLGGFVRSGVRTAHPLVLIQSLEQVRPRVVIAGNAAHTLHPIAAQGLNLSMRDVAVLAQVVVDAVRAGGDPGQLAHLRAYLEWREPDQRDVTRFTDGLSGVFASRFPPLAIARDLGLLALDLSPALKAGFARRAMGMGGHQPRLARGLAL